MLLSPSKHCKNEANFSDIVESIGLSMWCRMTSKLARAIYRQPGSILFNPPAQHVIGSTERRKDRRLHVGSEEGRKQGSRASTSISFPFLGALQDWAVLGCGPGITSSQWIWLMWFIVSLTVTLFKLSLSKGDRMILRRKTHLHRLMCVLLSYSSWITSSQVEF